MAAPPFLVDDLIECTVQQVLGSTRPTNTFFFLNQTAGSFVTAITAAQSQMEGLYSTLSNYLSTSWSVESFIWRDRSVDPGQVFTTPPSAAIVGDLADPIIPRQTALVASLRTGFAGPRYRGRVYLVGFTEVNNIEAGIPDSTMITAIRTEFAAVLDSLEQEDVPWAVASRGYNPGPPEVTWTPFATQVSDTIVDARWDTQRRRRLP